MNRLVTPKGTIEYGYDPAQYPYQGCDFGRGWKVLFYLEQNPSNREVKRFFTEPEMNDFMKALEAQHDKPTP